MSRTDELIIFQKMYDFTLWMTNHTSKFPKSHRFSYAVKVENLMIEILSDIKRANYSKDRAKILDEIDFKLDVLKMLCRLSKDLKVFNITSYEFSARSLEEIGRLLGGWKKKFVQVKGERLI